MEEVTKENIEPINSEKKNIPSEKAFTSNESQQGVLTAPSETDSTNDDLNQLKS